MAARRRMPPGVRPGFGQQAAAESESGVHAAILKQARRSGTLNLSSRGLTEVPSSVYRINHDVPEETRNVSLENTDERWWDQVDLTKLILASNALTQLSEDISLLPALTVLDVHDNRLVELPRSLGGLSALQKLNLCHNSLKEVPEFIGQLKNLQSLQLQHNMLEALPDSIGDLVDLTHLDLANNQLREVPLALGYLSRVTSLNISHNKIKVLPPELGSMSHLKTLDATHNELNALPEEMGNMSHLEQLYLRHNKLTHLPLLHSCTTLKELHLGNNALQGLTAEHLECLRSLCVLDVRDNRISRLPDEIVALEWLERLDVANNDLSGLPYELGNMVHLKSIVLDGNPMKTIRRDIIMRGTNELKKYLKSRIEEPTASKDTKQTVVTDTRGTSGIIGGTGEGVDAFTVESTRSLDYSCKQVDSIPEELWPVIEKAKVMKLDFSKNLLPRFPVQMTVVSESLTELYLGFNKLTVLDPAVGKLHKLYVLDVRNNQLVNLPVEISSMTHLREIMISCNRFRQLPVVLYKLPTLEVIMARDNQIEDVDAESLRGITQLASLDLQNNSLSQVPPALGLCTQLRSLLLEGNPFRVPRPSVLAKGTDALLEYLRSRIVN